MSGDLSQNYQGIKTAIVHIGTEKTGSTSIQDFMFRNAKLLKKNSCAFLRSAGVISNFRLVNYCKEKPNLTMGNMEKLENDPAAISAWKEHFYEDHTNALLKFQKSVKGNSTVIYSSEHFHSRVHHQTDIENLKIFLDSFYDKIQILVYLRRQDLLAMSAHNTSVQGGAKHRFNINTVNYRGAYYDYKSLLQRWENVFGQSNITARVFEKERLLNGNVVDDFCELAGITLHECANSANVNSNERLSVTAQETLLRFNHLEDNDPLLRGLTKNFIRQSLIFQLHSCTDNYPKTLPCREDVKSFYAHFKNNNDYIAEKWLNGHGFNESFDYYPEVAVEQPIIDVQAELEHALSVCIPVALKKNSRLSA